MTGHWSGVGSLQYLKVTVLCVQNCNHQQKRIRVNMEVRRHIQASAKGKQQNNGSSAEHQQDDEGCLDCWKGAILLATYLVQQLQSSMAVRLLSSKTSSATTTLSQTTERNRNEKLTCYKCDGVLQQPITLHCGHSMCRSCCCWRRRRRRRRRVVVIISVLKFENSIYYFYVLFCQSSKSFR